MKTDQEEADFEHYDPSAALASIPIGMVGLVAATLAKSDMSADACVSKAYEILEVAALGHAFLAGTPNVNFPTDSGVSQFLHHLFHQWDDCDPHAPDPHDHFIGHDKEGNALPIPFEEAIKIIIPKPGKKTNRLPLFRQWLMAKFKHNLGEAGDKITEWKMMGMPFDLFCAAFYSYPKWRVWKTKEERRKAASKSRKNKGQQGRVKSKKDKRLGARPPVEEMKKIFGR
jgi:hypothetical protein